MLTTPFKGEGRQQLSKSERDKIPKSRIKAFTEPENYRANAPLVNAVNVALLAGKPLLLTGEPGTGKTQLAYRVAWEFGMGEPHKFEVKSTSVAKDILYEFDMVGYFRTAQLAANNPEMKAVAAKEFISYQALGQAIIETYPEAEVNQLLSEEGKKGLLFGRRSVVLIDEIDKAPRDFPNDLLNELELNRFRIPELGESAEAKEGLAPIVILTSNSEKNLPEPFLRRCVYHHISFPTDKEDVRKIIKARVPNLDEKPTLAEQLLDLFHETRQYEMIAKKPSISEAIVWIDAIMSSFPDKKLKKKDLLPYWGILFKKRDDLRFAVETLAVNTK